MTKEEIIEMARQAGVRDDEHTFEFSQYKYLERFATLVAEKEREEITKEVENALYGQEGCGKAAKAIRARGQA